MLWRCAAVAAACVAVAGSTAAATHTVTIEQMRFSPDTLVVRRGDRVVWVNKDLVAHTATADRVFDSRDIAAGASWSHVVNERTGHYDYVCRLHPTMKATLTVE